MILQNYFYVGAMLAAMALISAWMFTASRFPVFVRVIAASSVVGMAIAIWLNFTAMLGYSVSDLPPDGSVLISLVDAKEEGSIYLWVADRNGPRGYRLPYSDGLARELLKAQQEAQEGGGEMILHLGKKGKGDKDGDGGKDGDGDKEGGKSPITGDKPPVDIEVRPLMPKKG